MDTSASRDGFISPCSCACVRKHHDPCDSAQASVGWTCASHNDPLVRTFTRARAVLGTSLRDHDAWIAAAIAVRLSCARWRWAETS
eukprot:scaffold25524_cov39-Tisochrysis_lutea.AAC.2